MCLEELERTREFEWLIIYLINFCLKSAMVVSSLHKSSVVYIS